MLPTSSKRKRRADKDRRDGTTASTNEITLSIELRQPSRMRLLDLNDKCLFKIFSHKSLDMKDLSSVAECCTRLKEITRKIFMNSSKMLTVRDLKLETVDETIKVFRNFGSLISKLDIGPWYTREELMEPTLELMIKYCSETLKSLKLFHCRISDKVANNLGPLFNKLETICIRGGFFEVSNRDLFSKCSSLVELKIVDYRCKDVRMFILNQFPKLERFHYRGECGNSMNFEQFIYHHENLREFRLENGIWNCTYLLPLIANNCKALEKLEISIHPPVKRAEFVNNLEKLHTLNLKELTIGCNNANITYFIYAIARFTSLELLQVKSAEGDSQFVTALAQLRNIKALHLIYCKKIGDMYPFANLDQLNELWIMNCSDVYNFSIPRVVRGLNNLKVLLLGFDILELDGDTYLSIARAVRKRPAGFPSLLKLGVRSSNLAELEVDVSHIRNVKLFELDDMDIFSDDD